MLRIIILAVLFGFRAGAWAQSNITNSGGGAVVTSNREDVCDTTPDGAAVYICPDTAFNFGFIRQYPSHSYPSPFGGPNPYAVTFQIINWQAVRHSLYDISGNLLLDVCTWLPAGRHTFALTGHDDYNCPLSQGFYLYRIVSDDTLIVKKYYFR
jgi:hypothetical protein